MYNWQVHHCSTYKSGSNCSNGIGIEWEVILSLFGQFRVQNTQWFAPTVDGYTTLATSLTLAASQHVPAAHKLDMAVLGVTVTLCLLHGFSVTMLDPLLLDLFIHDCHIHVIHSTLLADWHPAIKQVITDWIELSLDGDAGPFQSHFVSYHDLQVCCYTIWYGSFWHVHTVDCMTSRPWSKCSQCNCYRYAV